MTQRQSSMEAAPASSGRPRPDDAGSAEQFVAVMRQLRQWAGLSYRELEKRAAAAGHILPRATLSGALARKDLPREDLLAAFVHACGLTGADAAAWLEARRRLAVAAEPLPAQAGDGAAPEAADTAVPTMPGADDPPGNSLAAPGVPGGVPGAAVPDGGPAGRELVSRERARSAVIAGLRPRRRAAEDGPKEGQGLWRRSVVVSAIAVVLVIAAAVLAFAPEHRDGHSPPDPVTAAPSDVATPASGAASPPPSSAESGSAGTSPARAASSGPPAAPPPAKTAPAATPPPTKRTSPPTVTTDPEPNLPWPGPGPTSNGWTFRPSSSSTPSSSRDPYPTFPEECGGSEARDPCF
ncbi:helix-turn-helix domain-containing protein [Kitasatospora sp. NPDC059646]|uniref:helix-turn-helix domain-containing protein n=1 Tax=Kitasatospora sp. NPDC059646 TaxID=3346893 RepID=UPI0036A8DAA2